MPIFRQLDAVLLREDYVKEDKASWKYEVVRTVAREYPCWMPIGKLAGIDRSGPI
jgi:hypothetical protein